MKKLIVLLATALFLSSCTSVKFENPQPVGAPSISEFPAKMHGLYVSNNDDTLHLERNSFRYSSGKEIFVEAELSAEKAVLKNIDNIYILNLKDEGGWDVIPLKVSKNKIVTHYATLDAEAERLILELKKTSPVKEIQTGDGKFDHYLIAPTDKEFQRLLKKKLFSEKIIFRRQK